MRPDLDSRTVKEANRIKEENLRLRQDLEKVLKQVQKLDDDRDGANDGKLSEMHKQYLKDLEDSRQEQVFAQTETQNAVQEYLYTEDRLQALKEDGLILERNHDKSGLNLSEAEEQRDQLKSDRESSDEVHIGYIRQIKEMIGEQDEIIGGTRTRLDDKTNELL